jgi:hypothetical protein
MKTLSLMLSASAVALAFASTAYCADAAKAPPAKPNYTALNALPDWSGSWSDTDWETNSGETRATGYGAKYPLKPDAERKFLDIRKVAAAGGETTARTQNCKPPIFVGTMGGPESYTEFLFTPGRVTITDEEMRIRRIYTDGRKMPANETPTYQGFSVGHWEGSGSTMALVVETAAILPSNEVVRNVPGGKGIHVVERIHLKDPNMLQVDSVVEAPEVFTEPFHVTKLYKRHSDYTMHEFDCDENNRDVNAQGHQQFDLTPPTDLPPPPKD